LRDEQGKAFENWLSEYLSHKRTNEEQGAVAVVLQILEKLKKDWNLDPESHLTKNRGQVSGLGDSRLSPILLRLGETRTYLKEAGRTSRGSIRVVDDLLKFASTLALPPEKTLRNAILDDFQGITFKKVKDFFSRRKIEVSFNPNESTRQLVRKILDAAKTRNKQGQVAQYLVGAKLQLRYPDRKVENQSASTADDQSGRYGDFQVEDTVFHVTISPMPLLVDKCRSNLAKGLMVYVIVPETKLSDLRQELEESGAGQVMVTSIEAFVSQNLDEIASFSRSDLRLTLRSLFDLYNSRVQQVETDNSLLLEVPKNL
jgi:nitrogen regulatory protein PII